MAHAVPVYQDPFPTFPATNPPGCTKPGNDIISVSVGPAVRTRETSGGQVLHWVEVPLTGTVAAVTLINGTRRNFPGNEEVPNVIEIPARGLIETNAGGGFIQGNAIPTSIDQVWASDGEYGLVYQPSATGGALREWRPEQWVVCNGFSRSGTSTPFEPSGCTLRFRDRWPGMDYWIRVTALHVGAADAFVSVGLSPSPEKPTAAFTVERVAGGRPGEYRFTSTSTTSQAGGLTLSWDVGDNSGTRTAPVFVNEYKKPGTYAVQLTVRDARGQTDIATQSLVVSPPALNIGFSLEDGDTRLLKDQESTLHVSGGCPQVC